MLSDQFAPTFSPSSLLTAPWKFRNRLHHMLLSVDWKTLSAGLYFSILTLLPSSALAADVTLAWNPNSEDHVEGYGVYFSQDDSGPPYNLFGYVALNELSDSSSPAFTVTGLENGARYYFAVTAFDTAGNESDFSNSVCADVGDVITPCASANTGSGGETGSGGDASAGGSGGGGCFIESSAAYHASLYPGKGILIALGCMAAFSWIAGGRHFKRAFNFSRHQKPKDKSGQ